MNTAKTDSISSSEFDRRFEADDSIDAFIDWATTTRPNMQTRRVNVDFPRWMINALDMEAARLSVPRQAVIKMWLDERLKDEIRKRGE